jgi:hypothetical protein
MAEQEKRTPIITQGRMKLAEYERNEWVANVEHGVTTDDIQDPSFWSLMASQLKPYDHIEARAEDGSWVAYLIVTGCDRTWARMAVDRIVKLTTGDIAQTQAAVMHNVLWKGPQLKYSVIRLSDSENIKPGFQTKDEAYQWLREHERVAA